MSRLGLLKVILNPDVTDVAHPGDTDIYKLTINKEFLSFADMLPVKLSMNLYNKMNAIKPKFNKKSKLNNKPSNLQN